MIVDTHVHPIADDRKAYPRHRDLNNNAGHPGVDSLGQPEWPPFALAELLATMDESGIDKATLVQAYYTYHHDNRYVIDLAKAHPERFVSVVVLDEVAPESPDLLTDLVRNHRVRGWRIMGGRPKGFFEDPQVLKLWQRAESLGIPICLGSRYSELADIAGPIRRFGGTSVAIEHTWGMKLGNPLRDFAKPLLDLGRLPHVHLKVATPISHSLREASYSAEEVYGMLVETFGARRMMWGSNYPAHWHAHAHIKERLELFKRDLAFLGAGEQRQILGESALALWPDLK